MTRTLGVLIIAAGIAAAQNTTGDSVAVPLHDPSRPATVHVNVMFGSITVHGGDLKDVTVQMVPGQAPKHRESEPPNAEGMHRLDLPGNGGLDIREEANVVTVKSGFRQQHSGDLIINVPRRCSLELKSMNGGGIDVEGVDGEIDVNNLNGKITLKNVSGAVAAHSMNGPVLVSFDRIDPAKPMSFSTMNGDIDVTLPGNVKANVLMKTDHGEIYSDFDVKLDPSSSGISKEAAGRQADGTYHLRFDRTLRGKIDGGGPDYQFTSFNGQIYIRRKK